MSDHINTIPQNSYATNLPDELDRVKLPKAVELSYGCGGCDFKHAGMCPHGVKAFDPPSTYHKDGICPERLAYLKGFYRGNKDNPSFTEWESDLLQGTAMKQHERSFERLRFLEEKMKECQGLVDEMKAEGLPPDDENLKKTIKELKSRTSMYERQHNHWFALWKKVREFQETRLNRETPKKSEVLVKKVDFHDVAKVLREARSNDKVIDQ